MPDKIESSGLAWWAVIVSIPIFILVGRGVWLCGMPMPGDEAPIHPRPAYVVDEEIWRSLQAYESNDSTYNDPDPARRRKLTPVEEKMMNKTVEESVASNRATDFAWLWVVVGMPLSLLATMLSLIYFIQTLLRHGRGRPLTFAAALFALDTVSTLLTYWNARGTSFD
jgi:hypothetical protein